MGRGMERRGGEGRRKKGEREREKDDGKEGGSECREAYLACSTRAIAPVRSGADALVPVKSSLHLS